MKLLDKYNRLNITATILVFVAGSCLFYFLLNYILISQLDETLQSEKQEITAYVAAHNALPEIISTKDQHATYTLTAKPTGTRFTFIHNKHQPAEDLRQIQFGISVANKYYIIKVDKPLEGTESLLQIIIIVTVAMIALILLISYVVNRMVIRKLWQPFYRTIDTVSCYHLSDQSQAIPADTGIEEFTLLNNSISQMIIRIQQDYSALKDFTGQAAHEMQTPLAIIRARLDALIQNEDILERNEQYITDIETAVQRLSRLHQSLLLLTKVENKQFALTEHIQLHDVINNKCAEYADLAERIGITISTQLSPSTIIFHHQLTDILVNNLLGNAIRYSGSGGHIDISLQGHTLTIANTSAGEALDQNKLFKRFYKSSSAPDSNGLGLSIVKQICDLGGYPITYTHTNDQHIFSISFIPAKS